MGGVAIKAQAALITGSSRGIGRGIARKLADAEAVGALLKTRNETVAVPESSTGGLISAALLAVRERRHSSSAGA